MAERDAESGADDSSAASSDGISRLISLLAIGKSSTITEGVPRS